MTTSVFSFQGGTMNLNNQSVSVDLSTLSLSQPPAVIFILPFSICVENMQLSALNQGKLFEQFNLLSAAGDGSTATYGSAGIVGTNSGSGVRLVPIRRGSALQSLALFQEATDW